MSKHTNKVSARTLCRCKLISCTNKINFNILDWASSLKCDLNITSVFYDQRHVLQQPLPYSIIITHQFGRHCMYILAPPWPLSIQEVTTPTQYPSNVPCTQY